MVRTLVLGFRDQKVERRRLSFRTLTGSQELFRGGRPGMLEAVAMQKGGVQFSGAKWAEPSFANSTEADIYKPEFVVKIQ